MFFTLAWHRVFVFTPQPRSQGFSLSIFKGKDLGTRLFTPGTNFSGNFYPFSNAHINGNNVWLAAVIYIIAMY